MNYLKLVLAGLIIFALGSGLGFYFSPDKIKIQEKIVEKTVTEKDEKTTKKYDPNTGKLIEEIKEIKEKETNTSKKDKSTEKEKTKKHYAIKGGVAVNPRDLQGKLIPRVGGELRLPFFNSWVGAEIDVNVDKPLLGVYGRIEF